MPDITMCNGINSDTKIECPLRENCYRFTAKPNEFRQSYFITAPFEEDKCDHYWENQKLKEN